MFGGRILLNLSIEYFIFSLMTCSFPSCSAGSGSTAAHAAMCGVECETGEWRHEVMVSQGSDNVSQARGDWPLTH